MTATMRRTQPGRDALTHLPTRAILYIRLSELRSDDLNEEGKGKGNVDQEERAREHAARLGWGVAYVIVENDVKPTRDGKPGRASAFKRRKIALPNGRFELRTVRPGFRKALDLLSSGQADGFLALDLDRTVRDPRDLEDLIDVAEGATPRPPVKSVTGSLSLDHDADITMARNMVAYANKSSRDTARRVAAARERNAKAGKFGGGMRPYGFEPDGVTPRPEEYAILAECSRRVLHGISLRSMALELREADVPTVTGAKWSAETLRDILVRPRNGGYMVYQGEIIGDAPWPPAVRREVYEAVVAKLTDPSRRTSTGSAPKWLGTGLYRCGLCTPPGTGGKPATLEMQSCRGTYRCSSGYHMRGSQKEMDAYVTAHVLSILMQPDAIDLLMPARPDVDTVALRTEAEALRVNLDELAADRVAGLVTRSQFLTATERGRTRLDAIDATLTAAVAGNPLSDFLRSGVDPVATWAALPLANQRAIVSSLVTVTLMPPLVSPREKFKIERVRIERTHELPSRVSDVVSDAAIAA